MNNKQNQQLLLEYIKTIANPSFQIDEKALAADYNKSEKQQSLTVKIVSIFGGLLGSCTLVGFLLVLGLYDNELAMLILGAMSIVLAVFLQKVYDTIILDTASFAFYVIGFILMGIGLISYEIDVEYICVIFAVIAILVLVLVRNYILSFLSTLMITGSIYTLLCSNEHLISILPTIFTALLTVLLTFIFVQEAKIITQHNEVLHRYAPIKIALILSLIAGFILPRFFDVLGFGAQFTLLPAVVNIFCIAYTMTFVLKILQVTHTLHKVLVFVLIAMLLLPTVFSAGISGAILLLFLSFLVRYTTGFGISIIAFVYFISQYYYDLNYSLFTKSILLIASGLLFLGIYLFTHKKLNSDEKV